MTAVLTESVSKPISILVTLMKTSTVSKTTSIDLPISVSTSNILKLMSDAERDQTMPNILNAQSKREKSGPQTCSLPRVLSTESF